MESHICQGPFSGLSRAFLPSYPASRRLEINVADVMVMQHAVERSQVFPDQLLKVLCRFVAPLLQFFPDGSLLRGGRKIRTAIELEEQIGDLLQQHGRPATVVLPAAGELELQQGSLDTGELLPEVVCSFANGFRCVVGA